MTPKEFIQKIKELEPDRWECGQFIFKTLDKSFWADDFEFSNQTLKEIHPEDFNLQTLVYMLRFNCAVSEKLSEFNPFVKRLRQYWEKTLSLEEVDGLLMGLEDDN